MLWKDPVHEGRNLEKWLKMGHFPGGIVEAALSAKKGEINKNVLKGWLFLVEKAEREKKDKQIGTILANLHPFADQADFLAGSLVPTSLRENPVDMDGTSYRELFTDTDVLVISGFGAIYDGEKIELDRRVAYRGYSPPRVTVLVLPSLAPPKFAFAIETFDRRIQRV